MRTSLAAGLLLTLALLLIGCQPALAPVAATVTPLPEPQAPAPEQTFTQVGNVGEFQGSHGVGGKAIVAGLQTLIIQSFTFDGKGPAADLRLVHGDAYAEPAAILGTLEPRAYESEMLLYIIPAEVTPDNADRLVVYAPETGEVYAETTFD
ncbi:MAG: DM13 domain-containing protein [Chloroflexi bacterium]|nr:DM13 domain-containing protein [Chloroflexota bacterium]